MSEDRFALVDRALSKLAGAAQENAAAFASSPELLAGFWDRIQNRRVVYAMNPFTCGSYDCWRSWAELEAEAKDGIVFADCKQLSGALAGALLVGGEPALVGVKPGLRMSHAVAGIARGGPVGQGFLGNLAPERVTLLDPSVWAGMPAPDPASYASTRWRSAA